MEIKWKGNKNFAWWEYWIIKQNKFTLSEVGKPKRKKWRTDSSRGFQAKNYRSNSW